MRGWKGFVSNALILYVPVTLCCLPLGKSAPQAFSVILKCQNLGAKL